MPMKIFSFFILIFLFSLLGCSHQSEHKQKAKALSQKNLPPLSRSVITANFPDRSISALVTHLEKHAAFKRMIILMVGHPCIIKIKSADDYGMKGNFLMRSTSDWLDPETVVVAIDAPTDQWDSFSGKFRESTRYKEDLIALDRELTKTFGSIPQVIVGTSEGSVSAYYASLALQKPNTKVVLTSSLFITNSHSEGLEHKDLSLIKSPLLWVHHTEDPCKKTPYSKAQKFSQLTSSPLISVYSDETGSGEACQAFSKHGFIDVESEVVQAIKHWIDTNEALDVHRSESNSL